MNVLVLRIILELLRLGDQGPQNMHSTIFSFPLQTLESLTQFKQRLTDAIFIINKFLEMTGKAHMSFT